MKKYFFYCIIFFGIVFSCTAAQGEEPTKRSEAMQVQEPEDWRLIKENVRAINLESASSWRVEVYQNTISGGLYVYVKMMYMPLQKSDKSGYAYYFEFGFYSKTRYYLNL